jgi:hypothetical protein
MAEERAAELESLQAIFGPDLRVDTSTAATAYTIKIDDRRSVVFSLPPLYPAEPLVVRMETDCAPDRLAGVERQLCTRALEMRGETPVFTLYREARDLLDALAAEVNKPQGSSKQHGSPLPAHKKERESTNTKTPNSGKKDKHVDKEDPSAKKSMRPAEDVIDRLR